MGKPEVSGIERGKMKERRKKGQLKTARAVDCDSMKEFGLFGLAMCYTHTHTL